MDTTKKIIEYRNLKKVHENPPKKKKKKLFSYSIA